VKSFTVALLLTLSACAPVEVVTCERVPVSPMFTRIECSDGDVRAIVGCPANAVEVTDIHCECKDGFNMTFVDETFVCLEAP
jgi:hypothetical protein